MSETTINVIEQVSTVVVTQVDGPNIVVTTPTNSPTVKVASIGVQGPPGTRLVELVMNIAGLVPPSRVYVGYVATAPITLIPADALAIAGTANLTSTTITITTLTGTVVGTVVFVGGATTGVVTISGVTLTKGQGLTYSTDSQSAALADIIITIPANRG